MAITYSLVAADWEVNNITGAITYVGDDHHETSPSYATVIQFHRWLQGLADDQTPADTSDKMYIPIPKPSERSTDNIITLVNGFYIDDTASQHLYDGTISQNNGDDRWDGIVNFGNANVQIQVIRNGAKIADDFWNYNLGGTADSGSGTTLTDSGAFGATYTGYTFVNTLDDARGIAASNTSDTVTFAAGELYGTGTLDFATSDTYLIGKPLNPDTTQGISHRFLIKVRENGADIDGRRLIGICRRPGNTFAWFPINGTNPGNNVFALSDSSDLNYDETNQDVMGATWDSAFSGEDVGLSQFDVDDNSVNEDYFGKLTWTGSYDINDLYMRAMGETCDFGGYTVHGLDGEVLRGVTHKCGYNNEIGTPSISDYDQLSWGTFIDHDAPTGGPFQVGEVIVDADPATSTAPTFYATVISVDQTDYSLVVDIDSGAIGNTTTFYGLTSGADADTTADPTEVTGGGLLHILAHDATNDIFWVQVLKGTMAGDDDYLYYCSTTPGTADHTDYVQVADEISGGTITEYSISKTAPYIGVSTGSALIGAHGVGVDNDPLVLSSTDKVLPLGETTPISPPLTVTNTLSGVVSGQDYCFVVPTDGVTTDINGDPTIGAAYFTINTELSGGAETQIVVQEDLDEATGKIDGFLPSAGYIAVVNDEGLVVVHQYSGYTAASDLFTLQSSYNFGGTGVNDSVSVGNYAYVYQMHLDTALTTSSETTISVNAIPDNTPASGTVRVVNDDGFHVQCHYSSNASNDFTANAADTFVDGNVTVGTENIEITSHTLQDQMIVQLTSTGTLPAGLSLATDYWVIVVDDDNIMLAADIEDCAANTPVNITDASSGGTHTITPVSHDFSGNGVREQASIGAGVYVSYIDKLADATSVTFSSVYTSAMDLTSCVRDGGATPIKEDKKRWTYSSSNATLGVTRTSDT